MNFNEVAEPTVRPCSVNGCRRPHKGRGFCNLHYGRWRRTGDPELVTKRTRLTEKCSIVDCSSAVFAKNKCQKHYDKERNAQKEISLPTCERCDSTDIHSNMNKLCQEHFTEKWLAKSTKYSKGYIDNSGYRIVSCMGIKIPEHRIIMERMLGRRLNEKENIHHVNGQRSDNRIENLELWNSSQPYGQRLDEKLLWAKDFVATYDNHTNYLGLRGSTVRELNGDIPFVTGKELHVAGTEVYPGVNILMPGRHQNETYIPGGDAVICVTDMSMGWVNKKFRHDDFFKDVESKAQYSIDETTALMKEYLSVLQNNPLTVGYYPYLPGVLPHLCLYSWQVLAVIEHRRYKKYESSWGGMYLFPRFLFGISEGLWTAADAASMQRKGRPGVEILEKIHGTPVLTKELMS